MELRSFNVEKIYSETVKCIIKDELAVDVTKLKRNKKHIKSMVEQIKFNEGQAYLCACNLRTDGEYWTPYLQIVEMLIRIGKKIGCLEYEGKLTETTIIRLTNYGKKKK